MKYKLNKKFPIVDKAVLSIIDQIGEVWSEREDGLFEDAITGIKITKEEIELSDCFAPMCGYRLLKDTVRTKAGERFILKEHYYLNERFINERGCGIGDEGFIIDDVENNPEWFEKFEG